MNRAIFLDRDGIINKPIIENGKPYPPQRMKDFKFLHEIHKLLKQLKILKFKLLIITNQPDVARGVQSKDQVDEFHGLIMNELPIDRIYTCFHDNDDLCNCRKPKPEMIFQGKKDFDLDLNDCWMIGDRSIDIEAGIAAGCRTIFLDNDYLEKKPEKADYKITHLNQIFEIIKTKMNHGKN